MSKTVMEGVDVSKYQGNVDWAKVKASGRSFAMVRQGWINSNGTITEDPYYRKNMQGAQAAGVHTGVYLYSYATSETAMRAAANACIDLLRGFTCDMPVALDFEHANLYKNFSQAANVSLCKAFLARVEALGYYGILYTYKSFAATYLVMSQLKAYDFWLAHYTRATNYGGPYGMWQHTSSGSVPGISGKVDLNHSYKDYPSIIKAANLNGMKKMYTITAGPMSEGDKYALTHYLDTLGGINYTVS